MRQLVEWHPEADSAERSSPSKAFMAVASAEECSAFFSRPPPAEFEAPVDRWRVVRVLEAGHGSDRAVLDRLPRDSES